MITGAGCTWREDDPAAVCRAAHGILLALLWPQGNQHFSAWFHSGFMASRSLVLPWHGPLETQWASQGLLIPQQKKLIEGNSMLWLRLQHWNEILAEREMRRLLLAG